MKEIFQLINPDNTISMNRYLAHSIGLCEAIIYSALLSKHAWYESHDKLTEDGWFFSTISDLEESTALSGYQQRRCIRNLEAAGLIECRMRGIPARRYFHINDDVELLKSLIAQGEEKTPDSYKAPSQQALQELDSKECSSSTASCEENTYKTKVNNTKKETEVISNQNAAAQICAQRLAQDYGESFAELACDVVSEGLAGKINLTSDGRTIPADDIIFAYGAVEYEDVCHVAEYITGNGKIRNIAAYMKKALYSAVKERRSFPQEKPKEQKLQDDILSELRAQYL